MKKTEQEIEREEEEEERNRLEVNDLFLSVLLQNATWLLRATDTLTTAWLILAGEKTMQHHDPAPFFLLAPPPLMRSLRQCTYHACMHARTQTGPGRSHAPVANETSGSRKP
ncbi:unnamed protein product [Sphagnum jensenii]|uniref:Uncharacterized protein n=1 Tax=Sphagnum jensenii TaxID=128206 RepID=A0ABP1AM95_9BRYO